VKFVAPAIAALVLWTGVQVPPGIAVRATQERRVTPAVAGVDRGELMRTVRTLSQPSFEGRRTGSAGNVLARQFIRDAFREIGLAPGAPDFLQPFTFVPSATKGRPPGSPLRSGPIEGANVLAIQAGRRTGARSLVISAHYDHLGVVNGVTYPGADDNASGIAALLAVARYVHAHPPAHTIIFAAFDAEEMDLQGATAFVRAPPVPLSTIALDVNFDMVSRNDRHEIYAAGTSHSPSLKPIVEQVQQRMRVKILFGHDRPATQRGAPDDWTSQSDHGVFHQAGVPFIYFGVEDHPDYHQPTDTADKIDPAFFGDVVEMLIDFIVTADRRIS